MFQSPDDDVRGKHIWCDLVPEVRNIKYTYKVGGRCQKFVTCFLDDAQSRHYSPTISNWFQDFDKYGAFAEILEGVKLEHNEIKISIILLTFFILHIMASQSERLPNGFPEFGYLCFYCQVFHGNLWDIHMVPASRKSANKISEFFGHQSNYFCYCLFVCFLLGLKHLHA